MKKFIAILVILVMMVPCVALAEVYPPEVVAAACLKEFTTEPQMTVEKLPFDPKDNTEYTILAWDKDTEVCTIALPNDGVYVITTDGYSAFIIAGYVMWQKCPPALMEPLGPWPLMENFWTAIHLPCMDECSRQ